MRQGLLFKDSPENHFALFCERFLERGKQGKKRTDHRQCNLQFFDVRKFEAHMLETHNLVFGNGHHYNDPHWYHIENRKLEYWQDVVFNLPTRPIRRWNVTQEMIDNQLTNKICWCGKTKCDFEQFRIKYCCGEHKDQWWEMTDYPNIHRDKFLRAHERKCDNCNKKIISKGELEIDHIIALILGGHPWDYRNLQALCHECHNKKTYNDLQILKYYRHLDDNDELSIEIPDINQRLIEEFLVN